MKILDSSVMIGILDELDRPDLIDKILELGHDLAVPKYVVETELRGKVQSRVREMVESGKIEILGECSAKDLDDVLTTFPGMGRGEYHVMQSYRKMVVEGRKAYCILDERKARSYASKTDIKYTGLIGLLRMLKNRQILNERDAEGIGAALKDSGFRTPRDFVIYSSGRKFVGLSTIFFSRTYLLRDQATPMTNTSTVLKKALKKEKDARVSLRIVAVNMVAVQGQRVDDVAQSLMMSDDWVRQWVDRYESGGLDALRDRPRAGRPPKVRKDKLNKIIDDASRKRVRPHEVSDAIKRKTGVGYSSRHVLRLMRGRNLSPKKIQYVHVNHASPAAVSKWQKRERRVIAYHRRKGRTVGWGDESHHRRDDKSNALFWTEQGTPVSGTFTNDPQKVSAHGLLLEDTRHMVRLYDRANSDTFIDFLKEAHRRFGPLLIYEDRASYHQSRKVQEFLRDNPEIVLRYTPVGSPYVNPAEHMWLVKSRSSVSYKYHASFEDFCKDLSEHYRTVHYNIDPIKCMSQRPKRYAKF